jgi:hypothetical protein
LRKAAFDSTSNGDQSLPLLSKSLGSHRRAVLLPMGLLFLSMAVFGWGLQYKLSLYQGKDSITHLAPVAKLLSQKERPAGGQTLVRPADDPAWPVVVLMAALAFGWFQSAARSLRYESLEESAAPAPPCLHALLPRPPPMVSFPLEGVRV